ncbi:cytochrome P450 [Aspergillus nidulans var. acristatus]
MTPATKPIRLVRLAHVCYTHTDLAAASRFLIDFGFHELTQTVSPSTGQKTIYYRGSTTQQPFIYCAREGPEDAFDGAAFVVESREELDYAAKTLPGSAGIVDLEAEGVPGGGLSLTFHDPVDGFPFHLVWGQRGREEEGEKQGEDCLPVLQYNFPTEKHRPGNSTQRFKPGPAPVHKLGHFGMCVTDFARAYEFYTTRFNFKPSDLIHDEAGKDVTAFLHLNRGRELVDHHCFFIFEGPKWHVHHSSFETHDFDTQFLGHHWLREKGYTNCWGVGRHIMGSQIFDYWFDPSRFILEHYVDGDLVDETYPTHRSLASPDNLHVWGFLYVILTKGRREEGLPSGPPTLPILGNLHQIPVKGSYLKFTEWASQYGGLYSLKLGTGTAIVITEPRLVKEVIDRKSSKYSNRPESFVAHTITGGSHLLVMQYGPLWRTMRKLVHQHFMEAAVEKSHIHVQNAEAVQMLRDFCVRPDLHMLHPKRYSNSIIMSLVYGVRTPSVHTAHMTQLYEMMENWSKVMEPGNTPPVDIYSLLHYIPQKLFGNWLSRAKGVRDEMRQLYGQYLDLVDSRRKKIGSTGSFMDTVLDQNEILGLTRHQLYFLGGVLMEGGSDTSSSIILAFIHAMTKWPQVLKKAQAEIDSVIGEDRTPVWSDYSSLPYVAATVKEAMRWRPAVPLAFPHAAAEDDWVDGHFIPKGSTIIVNGWGMQHNEARFGNPSVFDPDHYKGQTAFAPELANSSDYTARDHYGYGTGRRICPGIHVAERNLFLAISKLIWAFSIEPGVDESGKMIEPDLDPRTGYSEGFLVCANDFPCRVIPRSEARRETIMKEYQRAQEEVFSRFESPSS